MGDLQIRQLRLTAFKSFVNAVLPLSPLTILIGRNGTGKSNALDALGVLARLAQGEDVRKALEGDRRDATPVRGGAEGCGPFGADRFTIGVTVSDRPARATWTASLDITVQVKPDARIIEETFRASIKGREEVDVLSTLGDSTPERSDVFAKIYNGKQGRNPHLALRSDRLLTGQLPLRLQGANDVERKIISAAERALTAISGVFQLDPVPHLMRGYVPEQDVVLRRTGENLSAAVNRLKNDPDTFDALVSIARDLAEHDVRGITIGRGGFGEVMLALKEMRDQQTVQIPARQMSDGMLRVMAIATALLTGGRGLALEPATTSPDTPPLCLVLEELENGLHPSQAAQVLDLVRRRSTEGHFQVIMTTHSPALLNALRGQDHPGVLVCDRDAARGSSRVRRLTALPDYLRIMGGGRLGDIVTAGRLTSSDAPAPVSSLDDLLRVG
jgi:energy-coupling factor transporter ATP-binding protein EcfA2